MPDAVNPDRNSLDDVDALTDGPADGDTIQFNATTGRWEAVQGGTSVPKPCWFNQVGSAGDAVHATWAVEDDGFAAFIDLALNVDPTKIQVVTTGTYCLRVDILALNDGAAAVQPIINVHLNNDDVGPLYDLFDRISLGPGDSTEQIGGLHVGCFVELVAGDLIAVEVHQLGVAGTSGAGVFTAMRMT